MRRLVYLAAAHDDIRGIMRHITRESGSVAIAQGFISRLRAKCQSLASLPGMHGSPRPELREELRSTPFHNYVILFRYGPERLEIVNILHASRDVRGYFGPE